MQEKIVVGNWKMHKTQPQAMEFCEEFARLRAGVESAIWSGIAVPFTAIEPTRRRLGELHCPLVVGAQNMHSATFGAFTGEIALEMLLDRGAEFVILGHSERRQHFGETDDLIHQKVRRALAAGMRVVLCVGETEEENRSSERSATLQRQLAGALGEIESAMLQHLWIAYEPVWAIGSGQTAQIDHVIGAHGDCRAWFQERYPGVEMRILYGGSVTPERAGDLRQAPGVDGILAGSASLSAAQFFALIAALER